MRVFFAQETLIAQSEVNFGSYGNLGSGPTCTHVPYMGSTFFFVFCVGSTYNISVKSKSDEYEDGGLKWIIGETEIGNPEPIPPSAVCKFKILCQYMFIQLGHIHKIRKVQPKC